MALASKKAQKRTPETSIDSRRRTPSKSSDHKKRTDLVPTAIAEAPTAKNATDRQPAPEGHLCEFELTVQEDYLLFDIRVLFHTCFLSGMNGAESTSPRWPMKMATDQSRKPSSKMYFGSASTMLRDLQPPDIENHSDEQGPNTDNYSHRTFTAYLSCLDSSAFSIRTVAAGYAIRISRLRLCASAPLNRSDMTRTSGTPGWFRQNGCG